MLLRDIPTCSPPNTFVSCLGPEPHITTVYIYIHPTPDQTNTFLGLSDSVNEVSVAQTHGERWKSLGFIFNSNLLFREVVCFCERDGLPGRHGSQARISVVCKVAWMSFKTFSDDGKMEKRHLDRRRCRGCGLV